MRVPPSACESRTQPPLMPGAGVARIPLGNIARMVVLPSRRQWLRTAAALVAAQATSNLLAQPAKPDGRLIVGCDSNLQASGLVASISQTMARDTGLAPVWQFGPSSALLPALERGELHAAVTGAPDTEALLERQGLVHDRRVVTLTDHVLVGQAPRKATKKQPASGDPAGVAGGRDIAVALARIAAAGGQQQALYFAHADAGASRAIEQVAWTAAGPQPVGDWLRTAATGAPSALREAAAAKGYALVERGIWMAHGAASGLAVLVEGDPRLVTTYRVMRSFRVSHPAGKLFVGWLTGPAGRHAIDGFGRGYRGAA